MTAIISEFKIAPEEHGLTIRLETPDVLIVSGQPAWPFRIPNHPTQLTLDFWLDSVHYPIQVWLENDVVSASWVPGGDSGEPVVITSDTLEPDQPIHAIRVELAKVSGGLVVIGICDIGDDDPAN